MPYKVIAPPKWIFGGLRCVLTVPTSHTTTTHPDIGNYTSKPAETFSPCYMMPYKAIGPPKPIFGGLQCVLIMPTNTTTTHPDIGNHISKPAETFSPCYMMLYKGFGPPQLIFGRLWCVLMAPPPQPYHPSRYWELLIQTYWNFQHMLDDAT